MDADAKTKTSYEKKKPSMYKWRENNSNRVTVIINTRYEKEVFKNGKVKPKRYTRLWKKIPRNVPQIPSKISPKQ